MLNKQIFYWTLYDFANSIILVNFILYFSQWLVLDGGLSDFWYNATFAISTLLLLAIAPILASKVDVIGHKKYYLSISTLLTFLIYSTAVASAFLGVNIFIIATLFVFGQFFYQLCFVFHTPMLNDISDESNRAKVAGFGQFGNALGQAIGILITLPFADSRLIPLVVALVTFALLSLPMIFLYKDINYKVETNFSILKEYSIFYKKFNLFLGSSLATPLLFAYFLYNDALTTITNNYSLYIEKVYHLPDNHKSILMLTIVIMNAVGGYIVGNIVNYKSLTKTLSYILISWTLLLVIIGMSTNIYVFIASTLLLGAGIGSTLVVTKTLLSILLEKQYLNYGFSFYVIFERFSSIVGPLVWGSILLIPGISDSGYRSAMISMAIFTFMGWLVIKRYQKISAS